MFCLGTGCTTRGAGWDHEINASHGSFSKEVEYITTPPFFLWGGKTGKQSYHKVILTTNTTNPLSLNMPELIYLEYEHYLVMLILLITQCLAQNKPSDTC